MKTIYTPTDDELSQWLYAAQRAYIAAFAGEKNGFDLVLYDHVSSLRDFIRVSGRDSKEWVELGREKGRQFLVDALNQFQCTFDGILRNLRLHDQKEEALAQWNTIRLFWQDIIEEISFFDTMARLEHKPTESAWPGLTPEQAAHLEDGLARFASPTDDGRYRIMDGCLGAIAAGLRRCNAHTKSEVLARFVKSDWTPYTPRDFTRAASQFEDQSKGSPMKAERAEWVTSFRP